MTIKELCCLVKRKGKRLQMGNSKNVVAISQEDFGTLCICALRYCHGRRTYMPSLVQEIVTAHFKDLSNKDLTVIANDERFQKDMEIWGDDCDKVDWQKFYRGLEQFRAGLEQTDCAWK